MTFLVDIAWDNTQLSLPNGENAWAIWSDKTGFLTLHISTNLNHILNRYMLGNADNQIQACLYTLHNGVSSKARWYEYYRSSSTSSLNSILNSVEYRNTLYHLTSLAWSNTCYDLGAIFQHLLSMEHCGFTSNALYNNLCIFI